MTQTKHDKRRASRYTVEGVHGKMVLASQVEILNLSLGGVAIKADRRLNVGADYTLKLEMGERALSVKGVVTWSVMTGLTRRGPDTVSEYSAGLRFTDVLTDRLRDLIGFIDGHKVSDENRLGGIRFQINAPGHAELDVAGAYKVKLVSLSGMLIQTEHKLEPEKTYSMEILPAGQEPIRMTGRVASRIEVQEGDREHHEIGIEFLEMSDEDRSRLEAFVAEAANGTDEDKPRA